MIDLNALSLSQLFRELTADGSLDRLLAAAFDEDTRAPGDITTASIIDPAQTAGANLVARQPGAVAGLAAIPALIGADVEFEPQLRDGDKCNPGSTLAVLRGSLAHMLRLERVLLNLVGRLSGIATLTRRYVDAVAGAKAVICDTRKTMPGMRTAEKYAVRCGGGTLHRVGLFDAVLYKDNHLTGIPLNRLAATIESAAKSARKKHSIRFVEVEADRLDQLKEILGVERGVVDMVLLDNMTVGDLRRAVRMRDEMNPGLLLEASGGVDLSTVRAIAETGVERIAVGAITHSAPFLDVGLDVAT